MLFYPTPLTFGMAHDQKCVQSFRIIFLSIFYFCIARCALLGAPLFVAHFVKSPLWPWMLFENDDFMVFLGQFFYFCFTRRACFIECATIASG